MITFENGELTTDATLSVFDTQAIFQFADYCVELEQERIIKLLEADPEGVIPSGGGLRAGYETAIALIKGEK